MNETREIQNKEILPSIQQIGEEFSKFFSKNLWNKEIVHDLYKNGLLWFAIESQKNITTSHTKVWLNKLKKDIIPL